MTRSKAEFETSGRAERAPAVVVGLDNITGLQTARILRDRGVPVVGVVADRRHFGARTNACIEVVRCDSSDDALVACLRELGSRLGRTSVLFPCTDQTVAALSRNREQLREWFQLPLVRHDVVDLLRDKASFARHATDSGWPIPRTEVLTSRPDAERAGGRLTFPTVLKPPAKSALWDRQVGAKAIRLSTSDELVRTYDRVAGWAPTLLVQEWIEGAETDLLSCNCYFDADGTAQATFVARKLRQWPPGVGTSASGEECRDDEVLATTVRVFEDVGFHGLAYLELKRDARTGRLLIIEPNVGRPTGRSAIAEAGGVELVYTAYCDAAGLPLPASRQQRYLGTKWLDVRRDAQAAVVARRLGQLTLRQWARSLQGPRAHAIWSPADPIPFAVDLAHSSLAGIRMLARGLLRRAAGRAGPRAPGAVPRHAEARP